MAGRTYEGMSYRQIQQWNKEHLAKALDKQRKQLKLKNIGWNSVIKLYNWLSSSLLFSSSTLDRLAQKAERLEQVEIDIKTVVNSVINEPHQLRYISQNNIVEFVCR